MIKKAFISTLILILLSCGVYFGGGYAVKPIATQFVRQNGFPEAIISSVSLVPNGLMIEKISLDGHDFSTVENIFISFNWMTFLQSKQIESLQIKDISLTAELDTEGHFKIAGWDATLPQPNSSSALIPIQTILLQGITIDLDTSFGEIRLQGKFSLETPTLDQQNIEFALWGQQHQLSFDAKGSGKLSTHGEVNISTIINEARVNLPNIELSRASGEFNLINSANQKMPQVTGKFIAGKINTLGALLQNVEINLDTTKPESLSFKTSPAGFKDIEIEGKWMTSADNYLELSIKSLKTLDVIEALFPDKVKEFKPWVENSSPLFLKIRTPFSSLQNNKKIADFNLSLGKKNSDMNLVTNGVVSYTSQDSKTKIQFDKTLFQIAKGKIDASPFNLEMSNSKISPTALTLSVQSVNMAELSKLIDIDGLSANGHLSGVIPITYSDKGIIFGQALLTNDEDGFFAYKPDTFPSSLQGEDERMQIVREALGDFKFSKLSFDINGELDKKMKTTLTAEGTNPTLGDRPIKLNLNLDGDLGAVLKQALQTGNIPDKIRSK